MKRTFRANINGSIFNIDEDAYMLLDNYLRQLHNLFPGNEGEEITADIENRIRELFEERISAGNNVIVLADVNRVIEQMGSPEAITESADGGETAQTVTAAGDRPFLSFNLPGRKRLYRNMKNKVFGGVIGGFATYLGWNANIMRLLYAALACCTYFWPLVILYLLLWMIIPPAETPRQLLEMNGEPVNVDTVGQAVIAASPSEERSGEVQNNDGSFFSVFFNVLGKMLMMCLALIVGAVCFGCTVGFLSILVGWISSAWFGSPEILDAFRNISPHVTGLLLAGICFGFLAAIILTGIITWGALAVIFSFRGLSKQTVITCIISAMIFIIVAAVLIASQI